MVCMTSMKKGGITLKKAHTYGWVYLFLALNIPFLNLCFKVCFRTRQMAHLVKYFLHKMSF